MSISFTWPEVVERLIKSMPWRALVLDRDGVVVAMHESEDHAKALRPCPSCLVEIGENYLAACEQEVDGSGSDRALAGLREALGGSGERFQMDYLRRIDGVERWFQVAFLPLTGAPKGTLVLHTEITGHKADETARREAESRYRTVVESTAAGYLLIDRGLRLVEANREFFRLVGRLAQNEQREMVTEWVSARGRVRFALMIREALETGYPQYQEVEWQQPEGATSTMAVNATRVLLGGQPHVAMFCLDLSVQKFAIASLHETEARYRAMVETQTELVCRLLPDSTLIFVNGAFCRFFERPRETLLGTSFTDLVPPEHRSHVAGCFQKLTRDVLLQSCEHEVRTNAGEIRWLQWVHQSIPRANGAFEIQGVGRDVTSRRQTEDALRRSRSEVEDLASRLINAHEEECRRIAREMHDGFSQQLAAHTIDVAVVAKEFGDLHPGLRARLQKLESDAMAIGDGIRTFSHQMHPAVVDRLGLPTALRCLCGQVAERAGIQFAMGVSESLPALAPQLAHSVYRIVQEMVANIARHSRATRFELQMASRADGLRLEIQDDGVGFDREKVQRSAALGLLSIEERVRYLHGTFVVESSPGRGMRAVIDLPINLLNDEPSSTDSR